MKGRNLCPLFGAARKVLNLGRMNIYNKRYECHFDIRNGIGEVVVDSMVEVY